MINDLERGAAELDRRIISDDSVDWERWDTEPEKTKVRPASDFMDEVIENYSLGESIIGDLWPWDKVNDRGWRFRPAELTIYGGESESWKSMAQGQVALGLMRQDARCLIASFEMRPNKTLKRMVRQAAGTDTPSIAYMKKFKGWTTGRLWLYDHLGNVEARKVLAVCRYAIHELGVKHIFLDSLMKMLRATDDYSEQKNFVAALIAVAQATDTHIHLVAHSRKPPQGLHKANKHDIAGGSEMEKQADNVVMFQRMDEVEDDTGDHGGLNLKPVKDTPDLWMRFAKQREGSWRGSMPFWFHEKSLCLVERDGGHWSGVDLHLVE